MTLSTHATLGALIGAIGSQNMAFVVVAAFASHFIYDAIPHWDYALASASEDKKNPINTDIHASGATFIKDLLKIGFDFCLGLVLAYLIFQGAPGTVLIGALLGALCAMLPDPLQFAYMKLKIKPLWYLQRFHLYMHAKTHLKDEPLIGVAMQVLFIGICAVLSVYIFNL